MRQHVAAGRSTNVVSGCESGSSAVSLHALMHMEEQQGGEVTRMSVSPATPAEVTARMELPSADKACFGAACQAYLNGQAGGQASCVQENIVKVGHA